MMSHQDCEQETTYPTKSGIRVFSLNIPGPRVYIVAFHFVIMCQ